jgi:hypothetical protein
MNPRLVVVIGDKGINLVRLVSKDDREEEKCLNLYQKVKKQLKKIDKELSRGA